MSDQDEDDKKSTDASNTLPRSHSNSRINRSISNDNSSYQHHLDWLETRDLLLRGMIEKYEIFRRRSMLLRALCNFEIAVVIDDSGSMQLNIPNSTRTRWNVIQSMVRIVVEFGSIFVQRGVNLYFLNQLPIYNVRDTDTIDQLFKAAPSGYTPLVPVLKHLFNLLITRSGHDKKLLVLIFTDGAPTDENNNENIQQLLDLILNERNWRTTYLSFVLCNEDKSYINTLRHWARVLQAFVATDQYEDELRWIREPNHHHRRLSFSDYLVRILVGAMHQNERFYRE